MRVECKLGHLVKGKLNPILLYAIYSENDVKLELKLGQSIMLERSNTDFFVSSQQLLNLLPLIE